MLLAFVNCAMVLKKHLHFFGKFPQKLMSCWRSYCAVGVLMLVLLSRVSLLLLTLWCAYCLSFCGLLHVVSSFTVFASIPAFDSVLSCRRSCCCFQSCCCLRSRCCERSWYCVLLGPYGAGLSAIADVSGVTIGVVDVSGIPFKHAVAGGPAVTGFPAVECVLAVASFPADPGVPILVWGFVAWDYQHQTIGLWLSD